MRRLGDAMNSSVEGGSKPRSIEGCRLCTALQPNAQRPWYDVPLLQSANFGVLASLGALVPGWLLIVPKSHVLSMAQLDGSLRGELVTLLEKVKWLVARNFAAPKVFENGAVTFGSSAGC